MSVYIIYIYIYPGSQKTKLSIVVPRRTKHRHPRRYSDTPGFGGCPTTLDHAWMLDHVGPKA